MRILSQVRSKCTKYNFSLKICLYDGCFPSPLPDLSCALTEAFTFQCLQVLLSVPWCLLCDLHLCYCTLRTNSLSWKHCLKTTPVLPTSSFLWTRKSDFYLLLRISFLFPMGFFNFFFFVSLIATSSLFALHNPFDLLHSLLGRVP